MLFQFEYGIVRKFLSHQFIGDVQQFLWSQQCPCDALVFEVQFRQFLSLALPCVSYAFVVLSAFRPIGGFYPR